MISVVYVSSAARPFSNSELVELLNKSRVRNEAIGITGILLYKDGNFMHAIEGEEQPVNALLARIERDPRHRGMLILLKEQIEQRRFPDSSMAFRNLESSEALALPGYSEFLNSPLTGEEFAKHPSRCQRLLLVFKRDMR
jgi:hypothetical protein